MQLHRRMGERTCCEICRWLVNEEFMTLQIARKLK